MLTEDSICNALPQSAMYRLNDGKGLTLEVLPTGQKFWRWRFKLTPDAQKRLGRKSADSAIRLGEWPMMSLAQAREKRAEGAALAKNGMDPAEVFGRSRSSRERPDVKAAEKDFEKIASAWHEMQAKDSTSDKYKKVLSYRLNKYIVPAFKGRPIDEIKPLEVLNACRRIQDEGNVETAHRVMSMISAIFRYGAILGYVANDPTTVLRGTLATAQTNHFSSIQSPEKLGQFYEAITAYTGSEIIKNALRVLVLTFPRPTEIRHMEWSEIDFDARLWRIKAEKMKMKRPHVVPLSTQVLEIIHFMQELTGKGIYVFPSPRSWTGTRPMSDMALVVAMRAMGYGQDEVCAHGFRHTASTMLNESQLFHSDAIERQLAHVEANKVRGTYNFAEYLDERRNIMQWWADMITAKAAECRMKAQKNREEIS